MIFNLFRYFSFRYLLLHPFRTFLTFLGVALGISLFLSINLINDATKRSLAENIESMTGKADLTITSDGMGFEETVVPKIQAVAGVKQIVPLTINTAYLNSAKDKSNRGSVVFLGIDLLKDSAVREYNTTDGDIIPDPLAFLNQPDSIIASKSWAKKNNLGMDDSVELLTKDGVKLFTIRGLIDDVGPVRAFEGNMAIMDIDGSRYNFGREGLYDRIDVILNHKRPVKEIKEELRQILGSRFSVEDKNDQSATINQMVGAIQEVTSLLGLISFFIGFLIIVNTVNTAISQRRKDIGSLRTFGAGTYHIIILFAGEFLTLALLSSFLGCWIGVLIAEGTMDQVAEGLNSSIQTNIRNMRIVFTSWHLFTGVSLSLLSSACALIYPLYKALQIHPIEAIKPVMVDFTMEKKPKILLYSGILGLFFYILTLVMTSYSQNVEFLQQKSLQLVFLITGLAGIALIGPYLVLTVLSALQRLPLPFLFKFSVGNLLKSSGRTASTSVHLSLAFTLVLVISSINISFKKTVLNWSYEITGTPHVLNVTSWGSIAGFQIQLLHESLKERLLELPNLNKDLPVPITAVRIVPVTVNGTRFMVKAFDNPQTDKLYRFIVPLEGERTTLGNNLFSQTEETILMSDTMLKRFHKKPGEMFEMETPKGKASFRIGGMIREFASPNGVMYFDRAVYKKYWGDELVSLFSVNHNPAISSEDYLAQIGPELNEKDHLQASFPSKIAKDVEKNLNDNTAMSDSTKWVALAIGTMGLLNSFLIALLQRFRELGCIRSIGMTKGQLLSMILTECVSLGLSGVFISFFLTLPVAYCWVNWTLTYMLGWKVDYYFEGTDYLIFLGVGLFVSFVAGIFPAMKAAKLKLREALEYE